MKTDCGNWIGSSGMEQIPLERQGEDRQGRGDRAMRHKTKMRLVWIILAGLVLTAVGPCTITHKYGPYSGKVIEKETGDPIEGAYVLMIFYTEMYTPGGFVSKFVETRDATTDKNGEFKIGAYRAWAFRFPQRWKKDCFVTIFKPGYGAFPNNASLIPEYIPFYSIPAKDHVKVSLPRLRTYEDRLNNLHSIPPVGIPDEKLNSLMKLIDKEYNNLGFGNRDRKGMKR